MTAGQSAQGSGRTEQRVDLRGPDPRQETDWLGWYRFEDDPEIGEGPCRVVDISRLGFGVQLFDDGPVQPVGHRLAVDIRANVDGVIGINMGGVVRNVARGLPGGVRLGIEMVEVSDVDGAILEALSRIRVRC